MVNNIKSIMIPIDFSDYSRSALKYAVDFARTFKAKMHLVYVLEPSVYPADFSMGQISLPAVEVETTRKAMDELENLAKTEITSDIKYDTKIRTGSAFVEIIEHARETDTDLIIISTHGHTGVEHLLFGSTAEKIVRKAPCPVLTLRKPAKGFKYKS